MGKMSAHEKLRHDRLTFYQEDIERMGEEARRIAGVRAVENLVHTPGTPAPASRSKLERQRAGE